MLKPIRQAQVAIDFVRLVKDPELKLERVLSAIDRFEGDDVEKLVENLPDHERVQASLDARPSFGPIDPNALLEMPVDSLGYAYGRFLVDHGFSPDDIPPRPSQDSRGMWAASHLRQTHDLWHTLTGFGTDIAGEAGLQGFYMAQIKGPLPPVLLAAILLNGVPQGNDEMERRMEEIQRGWAMGKAAEPLFGMDWRAHFARPLVQVRQELGLPA